MISERDLAQIGLHPSREATHPSSRARALGDVRAELDRLHVRPDRPVAARREYGPGCVCLGVAGPIDRDTAQRLEDLLAEVRVRGYRELIVTLAGLGSWHPNLARVLARARIKHLVAGAHVELHDIPDPLAAALGPAAATTFRVVATAGTGRPAPAARPGRRRTSRVSRAWTTRW